MAFTTNPLFTQLSGKVGDLVIYQLNGKTVIRKRPEKKASYQPSKLQAFNQKAFRIVQQYLLPLKGVLDFGFSEFFEGLKKGIHLATSWALKNAISGQDDQVIFHPNRIKISAGDLPLPGKLKVEMESNHILRITWDAEGSLGLARTTDFTYVVLYHPEEKRFWEIKEGSHRSKESQEIALPHSFQNLGMVIYFAFYRRISKEKCRFSDSICLELDT